MPLLLAPYNDSMTLGQGFNSYTHELCIDNAVKVTQQDIEISNDPAQVVNYASRFVYKLSDVLNGMKVSFSSSIKKGTVDANGSTNTIDETTFKNSDLNVICSVQVTNQTISVTTGAQFQAIPGIDPGTARFNETYGDSYISGFIEGGEFTGILSMKVLDQTQVSKKVDDLKSSFSNGSKTEVNFESFDDTFTSGLSKNLQDVETTMSVSWQGGGQIKTEDTAWDVHSMYAAAAAFPGKVAKRPQRTWAILTKYKANRSFMHEAVERQANISRLLQYDQISSYTAELFDNFMDYKVLLKSVQEILSNKILFKARSDTNAFGLDVKTLLALKTAFQDEQTKIVHAIEVLSLDPGILRRRSRLGRKTNVPTVDGVIDAFMKSLVSITAQGKASKAVDSVNANYGIDDFQLVTKSETDTASKTSSSSGSTDDQKNLPPMLDFNFETLIPPEVFEDLMPVLVDTDPVAGVHTMLPGGAPPPPPRTDEVLMPSSGLVTQFKTSLSQRIDKDREDHQKLVQEHETLQNESRVKITDLEGRLDVAEKNHENCSSDQVLLKLRIKLLESELQKKTEDYEKMHQDYKQAHKDHEDAHARELSNWARYEEAEGLRTTAQFQLGLTRTNEHDNFAKWQHFEKENQKNWDMLVAEQRKVGERDKTITDLKLMITDLSGGRVGFATAIAVPE